MVIIHSREINGVFQRHLMETVVPVMLSA